MPRIARAVIPGIPHHIVQRGVRSMDIFECDADRNLYLELLTRFGGKHGLDIWAWCLMTNHIHLAAVPRDERSLALTFGNVHKIYARKFNSRMNVRGHLFQERFYSYPVQMDGHFLAVVRYIECNPIEAGLAARPEDYAWSSARHHATGRKDRLVTSSPVTAMAGDWTSFLRDGQQLSKERAEIERRLSTGRPWGAPAWVQGLEARLERSLTELHRGRPPKNPRK